MAGLMAQARFNTAEHPIFDYKVVCLAGDGCMQEGVAMESLEFAGHQKLSNLILIYDFERRHLGRDGGQDAAKREHGTFASRRWSGMRRQSTARTMNCLPGFAFAKARKAKSGKPQLIIARTLIGKGIPEVAGTQKAHGEGGAKFADSARGRPRPSRRPALLCE